MYEVLNSSSQKIEKSEILNDLNLKRGKYFVISCHREENVDDKDNFKKLFQSLNKISELYNMPLIFPIHPRTKKILSNNSLKLNSFIKLIDPLGFIDYNKLQMNSFVVLSDSGTISEESSILNFRAINIRETHERHEAMEESSVIMTGLDIERILQAIESLKSQEIANKRNILEVPDYKVPNISIKIERIIISYINYVNRVIWQKES